jgi:hypothetical protein
VFLWIHDILVPVPDLGIYTTDLRIRILFFSLVANKMPHANEKCVLFKVFTYYILKSVTVYIDKKSKSHKILKIAEGFSYSFPLLMEVGGSGSVQISGIRTRIRETQKNGSHYYKHLPITLVGDVNLLVRLVNDLRERKYRN